MAWGRFGFGPADDDQPIEFWMDDQNDQVTQRDTFDATGQQRWEASTRSGQNLAASRPVDVAALGASGSPTATAPDEASQASDADSPASGSAADQSDAAPSAPTPPAVRYVKARAGDNITALVGSGDPGAVGAFARLNGMDGRNSTIYAGRVYALPSGNEAATSEDVALGRQLSRHDSARLAALRAQRAANDQFQARFDANQNVWTGQSVAGGPPSARPRAQAASSTPSERPWYDNPLVTIPAGAAAFAGGLAFGSLVRGPVRAGQFIGDTLDLGARLADPYDAERHPLHPARDQVNDVAHGFLDLARWAASDPRGAARLGAHKFHDMRTAHDPTSIPLAHTLSDEVHNQFDIGANDGEFLTPLEVIKNARTAVDLAEGGEEVARAARYAAKVKPKEYERLIARGDPPPLADFLSDPYPQDAMGSHFVARREKYPDKILGIPLPESVAGRPLPRWYIDSQFNVNKFEGMSRDQALAAHYGYDPSFHGARLPADVNGGKGWSGRLRGARRYGPVERIVKGAPPPLKRAVAGATAVGGLTAYNVLGGDRPE